MKVDRPERVARRAWPTRTVALGGQRAVRRRGTASVQQLALVGIIGSLALATTASLRSGAAETASDALLCLWPGAECDPVRDHAQLATPSRLSAISATDDELMIRLADGRVVRATQALVDRYGEDHGWSEATELDQRIANAIDPSEAYSADPPKDDLVKRLANRFGADAVTPVDFSGAPMSPPVSTSPSPAQSAGGVAARALVPVAIVLGSIPPLEAVTGVELHFETHPLASVELDGGSVKVTYEKGPLDRRCVRFDGAGADEEFCLAPGSEDYLGPNGERFATVSPHPHRVQLDPDAVERVASKLIPSELSWWEFLTRPLRWRRGAAAVDTEQWERLPDGQWRSRYTGEVTEHPPGGERDFDRPLARLTRSWIRQLSTAMHQFSPLVDIETEDPELRAVLAQLRQTTSDLTSETGKFAARKAGDPAYRRLARVLDEGPSPSDDPDYRERLAAALRDVGFDSEWGPSPDGRMVFLLTPTTRLIQRLERVLTNAGYSPPQFVFDFDMVDPVPFEGANTTGVVFMEEPAFHEVANGWVGWVSRQYERHLMGVAEQSGTPYFLRSTYRSPLDRSYGLDGDSALRQHQMALETLAQGLSASSDLAASDLTEIYGDDANPVEEAHNDALMILNAAVDLAQRSSRALQAQRAYNHAVIDVLQPDVVSGNFAIEYVASAPNPDGTRHVVARIDIFNDRVEDIPDPAADLVEIDIPLVDVPFDATDKSARDAALERYMLRQNEALDFLDEANIELMRMATEMPMQLSLRP